MLGRHMRNIRRALQALIFVIPLVAISWLTILIVRQFPHEAEPGISIELAARLQEILGHEVHVGKVFIKPGAWFIDPPTTKVYDIQIAKGKYLAGGLMLHVRKAELDIDIRDAIFNPKRPFIANIDVFDPWLLITRSKTGVWNFSDMIRPRPEAPKRQAVGTVNVQNAYIEYEDEDAPRNAKRPQYSFKAACRKVNGHLQFNADKTVTWTAAGVETTGSVKTLAVLGSYEPDKSRLYVRVDANTLLLKRVSPLFPVEYDALSGALTGRITLLREKPAKSDYRNDLQI